MFDLVRYWYANGRPSRVEVASTSGDLQYVYGYNAYYIQYNWHGDAVTFIALDGSGGGSWGAYDPWGNASFWPPPNVGYYRWNAAWGYLRFDALGLYYVHGRWYSPDTGLFLSPDENGEYLYGSGQDAVNFAWCALDFTSGAVVQFADEQTLGFFLSAAGYFGLEPRSNACINTGRLTGRAGSQVLAAYLTAQGMLDIGTGLTGGTLALACAGVTAGGCSPIAVPAGGVSLGLILKGTVESAYGGAILYRIQQNPLAFARDDPTLSYGTNTGDTQRNADILRRNMGVGKTPGWEAHHIVPSTHSHDFARQAREILHRLGIDINAAENGVLLPKAIHDGLANNPTYMRAVLEALEKARTREQAINTLHRIGEQLLAGTFPR